MRGIYDYPYTRSEWAGLIDAYIFSERDRAILKRRMLDGITYEALAEEYELSTAQVKRIVKINMDRLIKRL